MRLLILVVCLAGCTTLGYPAGTVTIDGTELRFDDATMTVRDVGGYDDWSSFRFSADPPIRLTAQGQVATVDEDGTAPLSGPIVAGQTTSICNLEGPGYSVIVISTLDGGAAQFNLELPAC